MRVSLPHLFRAVAVWGGGVMGSGIAQVVASAGVETTIVEKSQDRLNVSRKNIERSLTRIAKSQHKDDVAAQKALIDKTVSRIAFSTDEELSATASDLIIEAIVENLELKKQLFAKLDKLASKETIFCTNTSSLRVTEIASSTSRLDRFAGMHFFSPVPMMKLVEVVRTPHVNESVIDKLVDFARKINKVPVVVKDEEGFIVNRLLIPYQYEAFRLVESGAATFKDVDVAMKLGCGYPMGPFELADSVGLDVYKLIVDEKRARDPENPMNAPSKLIETLVAEGKLGKKTGEGFYKYDDKGRKVEEAYKKFTVKT